MRDGAGQRAVAELRVGVTGHSNLVPECLPVVRRAVRDVLTRLLAESGAGRLVGLTCLAPGADQLFADVVLELGGQVEVVLPAADYREKLKPAELPDYDRLLGRAALVSVLPFARSGRPAYLAASERVIASAAVMVAVWDGKRAGGIGGTADVVAASQAHRVPVHVVWPPGAARG